MTESAPAPHRQHYKVTFLVLAVAGTAYSVLQSMVLPALPDIQQALHSSEATASWILTAFLLSASVGTPIIGRLGDMHGKERVLLIVLVLLAVGTLMSAVATSMPLLLAGRVVQGVAGGIFPLAFAIIRDEFPAERVAGGIGLMSSLLGIGGAAGLVLAGFVVEHLSYHWLFWIPLFFIVPAAIATHFFVPESPIKTPNKINWLSAALMSVGFVIVLVAVSETTTWGWGSFKALGLIAVGLVVLAFWVANELRSDVPLVDMRMMQIKGVWTTNAVAFLLGMGMYSAFILIPQYVQEPGASGVGFGSSVIASGFFLLPSAATMFVVGQFSGRIEHRFGSKPPLIVGTVLTAGSFVLLTASRTEHWEVYLASLLMGAGIGLAFAAMANLIVDNVRQDQTGVATGMNVVMRSLGGALGGQIAATFVADSIGTNGFPTNQGFTLAFGMCALAMIAGLLVAFVVPARAKTGGGGFPDPRDVPLPASATVDA